MESLTSNSEDRLLREPEVVEITGIPSSTLRKHRMNMVGPPFVRVGSRSIRYRLGDLNAWIEARTVDPAETRDASEEVQYA